jgi:hypothetical protein
VRESAHEHQGLVRRRQEEGGAAREGQGRGLRRPAFVARHAGDREAAQDLDVEGPGDDKTKLRREIYNEAVDAVREGGKLGSSEAAELAKIQKFLELRDDQVEKTK